MISVVYHSYFFIGGVISFINLLNYIYEARLYGLPVSKYDYSLIICLTIGMTIAWPSLVIDAIQLAAEYVRNKNESNQKKRWWE